MKTKTLTPGDKVSLTTKEKIWKGNILESYDPEIILLKLESGYNIGIRENEVLDVKVLEKVKPIEKKEIDFEKNPKLKNVVLIITGGTISSRLDPKSGAVISTDIEEILNIAPEIKKICNIVKISSPFLKFSEDMDSSDWKTLAKECEKYLNDKKIDGIIITHGTDTLHYTGAALSFFIRDLNKPIALTYSQRSIDRASSDANLNLICAARYATSEIAEVSIIGHKNSDDEICVAMPATKTRKMHTSRRDAFKVINDKPIAEISSSKLKILKEFNAKDKSRDVTIDSKFEDKIAIINIHPGLNPKIIDYYFKEGYKGLILETTGLGHIPGKDSNNNFLPKIKKAIDNKMIICATPQTIYGRLNQKVYSAGRELEKTGIIFLEDMLSETALVKLGWVLGHQNWKKKEKMLENMSGEFNKRIVE